MEKEVLDFLERSIEAIDKVVESSVANPLAKWVLEKITAEAETLIKKAENGSSSTSGSTQ